MMATTNNADPAATAPLSEALSPGRAVAALLLPPLAVFVATGISSSFWLAVLLTCLGFLPGVVFAFFILLTRGRARPQAPV